MKNINDKYINSSNIEPVESVINNLGQVAIFISPLNDSIVKIYIKDTIIILVCQNKEYKFQTLDQVIKQLIKNKQILVCENKDGKVIKEQWIAITF